MHAVSVLAQHLDRLSLSGVVASTDISRSTLNAIHLKMHRLFQIAANALILEVKVAGVHSRSIEVQGLNTCFNLSNVVGQATNHQRLAAGDGQSYVGRCAQRKNFSHVNTEWNTHVDNFSCVRFPLSFIG